MCHCHQYYMAMLNMKAVIPRSRVKWSVVESIPHPSNGNLNRNEPNLALQELWAIIYKLSWNGKRIHPQRGLAAGYSAEQGGRRTGLARLKMQSWFAWAISDNYQNIFQAQSELLLTNGIFSYLLLVKLDMGLLIFHNYCTYIFGLHGCGSRENLWCEYI